MKTINVLVLERDNTVCVIPAVQIYSFDSTSDTDRDTAAQSINLDPLLGFGAIEGHPSYRTLTVKSGTSVVRFRTRAAVHFADVDTSCFWDLPALLRESSCQSWVRGLVSLSERQQPSLGVWLDISRLAEQETPKGTEG